MEEFGTTTAWGQMMTTTPMRKEFEMEMAVTGGNFEAVERRLVVSSS